MATSECAVSRVCRCCTWTCALTSR